MAGVNGYVLDSSAVIALLKREQGGERVRPVLAAARMSSVNLAEVVGRMATLGVLDSETAFIVRGLTDIVVPFDAAQARETGEMILKTVGWGLSLGDRACLVLARRLGRVALTSDRIWADLDLGNPVELIR